MPQRTNVENTIRKQTLFTTKHLVARIWLTLTNLIDTSKSAILYIRDLQPNSGCSIPKHNIINIKPSHVYKITVMCTVIMLLNKTDNKICLIDVACLNNHSSNKHQEK